MNEIYESANVSTFTCEFGSITLDLPLAQQPSLQEFLDVTTAQENRIVSDELLNRFLAIADCVINQELSNSFLRQSLVELQVGYQVWKAIPPNIVDYVSPPEDLLESGWVSRNEASLQLQSETETETNTTLVPIIEKLMQRFREEARQRIDTELLSDRSLHILIYGVSIITEPMNSIESVNGTSSSSSLFGVRNCGCRTVGTQRYGGDSCDVKC